MKHSLVLLISLSLLNLSYAQITHESPHVKDGQTIRFTLPKGYFLVEGSDITGDAMFFQGKGVEISEVDPETAEGGILMIMHLIASDSSKLEDYLDGLETSILDKNERLNVIEKPKIEFFSDRKVMHGGFNGERGGENVTALYFSTIRFGNYYIFVSYQSNGDIDKILPYEKYIEIIATSEIVDTTKEDWFDFEDEEIHE